MTTIESDGFQTVPARKRFGARYEDAGFSVWQELNTSATFRAMLAYKHGSADDLRMARNHLTKAIAIIDVALSDDMEADQ